MKPIYRSSKHTMSVVGLCCVLLMLSQTLNAASRIKDLASVQGVRSNQLVGYGLVVGLPGTGETTPFTEQSFRTMLSNFGISLDANVRPNMKNVAAVAVHADLPAFAKPGQSIDVTVSSVGSANSLQGGTLVQTFLRGLDGEVYAVAQGSLVVSGFGAQGNDGSRIVSNTPTVGTIANGATVERSVPSGFMQNDYLVFNLNTPDFSTANAMSAAINQFFGTKPNTAFATSTPLDAASVKVNAPRSVGERIQFLSMVENIQFTPALAPARIVINSRTGTIVVGQDVKLLPAAITHGGLTVTISENFDVNQPNALADGQTAITQRSVVDVDLADSRMFTFDPGVTLDTLVRAVNEIGAAPGDLMAILEALRQAGALQGELIVI